MDSHFCSHCGARLAEPSRDSSRAREKSLEHRVLVVEDEGLLRWSLVQTLLDHGFAVMQASSGAEALNIVATGGRFDVALLDLRLPDSNDLSLLATLRRLIPHTAVIMMTAFSTPETTQSALELGAIRVVGKPFEMGEMADFVRQAC
jgi:DNA-binding NtrC family response regulator